jgi:HEAT repeat protein
VTRYAALLVIASLQLVFVGLTLALLLATRHRRQREREHGDTAKQLLSESLASFMLAEDRGESLAGALARLRPEVAARELLSIGGARLPAEQRQDLATLVRGAPWVEQILAQAGSRRWWKRLEAARLLVMVCVEDDGPLVARLLLDPHPAVMSAATAALAGCASPALVTVVVNGLPSRSPAVRLQQCIALRQHADIATAVVVRWLAMPAPPLSLRAWIQLVEVLGTPAALAAVVPFASHPDVDVRTSAARALRYCFSPEGAEAVTRLLLDEDWRVRAAAARAVGALNVRAAIPTLIDAMHDEAWWVRFRAGLALADLSHEGKAALADVRSSQDPFARDMATLVCGLSDGSRLELTSA